MARVFLQLRHAFRPVRVASFYSMFLTIVIIFATIFYIQIVSHFNISLETSVHETEDLLNLKTEPVMLFTTRGSIKNSFKNESKAESEKYHNISSFNISSSQVIQHVLRYYYALSSNRTSHNLTKNFLQLNDANKNNKSEILIKSLLRINDSDNNSVANVPATFAEKISLNSSKRITTGNEIPEVANVGAPFLPVNISRTLDRHNDIFLNEKQFYRNLTRSRKHNLRTRNSRRPNYCPLWPNELVGPMPVDQLMNLTEIPKENLKMIKEGGKYKPQDCDPRERTAIIIPYRDREKNLMVLLRHLHTVLQRQKIEYGIFVIEMAYPTQFNRGLLANVGYLTASSIAPYTCYIIHDVDLLMQDDRNMYRCGRVPRHLTASNSKFKNKLPYLAYFGGVEAFTPDQYWKVNGFSNLYFGWGGEDDDMVYRIFFTEQHFSRPRQQVGGYVAIEHGKDSSNPQNPNRASLVKSAGKRMRSDGVKSVMYNRLALEFKPLFTWVYVAAKEAKIMEKYQDYLDG
ncbi:beta-1,4-galactosyltransferase 2-like isoform X2 [Mercenaria mercenaria]|uniref:beta-1,4-galactosyltransferase 2-like isoform X2 n=1 Tax=Mercenaria mercenaria TaxID=6596 RepID=UPI00234EC2DA|nr:beta-1,4-galactosyltransferase 2-like isoform X2 [Mercenaria mercenaria]